MLENYPRALANTLVEEGGWSNHPNDPGGPTMRGVIQKTYDAYRDRKELARQSVRHVGEAELQDIYRSGYAVPIRFDEWPKGPDQVAFDIAVNSGPARTWAIAKDVLGKTTPSEIVIAAASASDKAELVKRLCARRARFYQGLSTFATFGKGWMRRNARMEALGVKMALEAAGALPRNVAKELETARDQAADRSRTAGKGAGGAAGAGGATGGGATQVDAASWDWSAIIALGVMVLALAGLALFLLWLWRRHRERAKAYAMATKGTLEVKFADVMFRIKTP